MRISLLLGAWRSVGKFELTALAFKAAWAVRISLPGATFDAVGRPFHNLSVLPLEAWAALTCANLLLHLMGILVGWGSVRRALLALDAGWWCFLTTQEFEHSASQVGAGLMLVIALVAVMATTEVGGGEL